MDIRDLLNRFVAFLKLIQDLMDAFTMALKEPKSAIDYIKGVFTAEV